MKTKLFTLLFLLSCTYSSILVAQAQFHLQVLDPQRPWHAHQGTIEEALIIAEPHGTYTEVEMYLTFSARNTPFHPGEVLEVVLDFSLPAKSIVYDSWLWIEDYIVKADIFDRWTASNIYEDIVDRNRDPSILFKQDDTQYQLRIFPLPAQLSRKVKLSYLVPNQWSAEEVFSPLPRHIIGTSAHHLEKVEIRTRGTAEWQNPRLANAPASNFVKVTNDTLNSTYWKTTISSSLLADSPSLIFDAPLVNGVYLNRNEEEKIYQMVMMPAETFGLTELSPKKVAVMLDYNANNSRSVTQNDLVDEVKRHLLNSLSVQDSFNLLLSGLFIEPISSQWLPADRRTIDSIFNNLADPPLSGYTNLPALLGAGINYIKKNTGEGELLLFTNSDGEGSQQVANTLINDVLDLMGSSVIPLHICDFQNKSQSHNWINGTNYRGNEYLYTNLSRLTAGNYVSQTNCCSNFEELVTSLFETLTAIQGSFDIHTTLLDGFCYNRYHSSQSDVVVNLNRPFYEIGKYEGSFPFVVEAAGIFQDNLFQDELLINSSDIALTDSLAQEIWVGNRILAMEKEPETNQSVADIIDLSIRERVLSLYTAFIALEISQGGEVCTNCQDESSEVTDVEDIQQDTAFQVEIYPNPFGELVNIKVTYDESTDLDNTQIGIYNSLGQLVRRYNTGALPQNGLWELQWNGRHNNGRQLSGGIYHFVIQSERQRQSHKLVFLP